MGALEVALALVLLHGPSGHEIHINPAAVTSMHAAIPGKENEFVTDEARCVISLTDGKFVSVIETCDRVSELLKQSE